MIPKKEWQEMYGCTEGKVLLVCDECGHLYCAVEEEVTKEWHRCYGCREGGIK